MDTLRQDLRDAFRKLLRAPGFTIVAIAVLAIGLGVNTAIFSLINAFLFRPLPVRAPEELVFVYQRFRTQYQTVSDTSFLELASRKDLFKELAGFGGDNAWSGTGAEAALLRGAAVTDNYFSTLGVVPAIGRDFRAGEDSAGAEPTVVISHDFWLSRFQADASIVGRRLGLGGGGNNLGAPQRDYTIIGVAPAGFRGTGSASAWSPIDYWVPARQRYADYICPARANTPGYPRRPYFVPVGRLADGVSFEQVAAFITTWGEQQRIADFPNEPRSNVGAVLMNTNRRSLPYELSGRMVPERLATALIAVSGLVLLIAASNLVGLLLSRGVLRRNETGIRLALGSGRWRIARMWLTESLLLSVTGGLLGLLVARLLIQLFLNYVPAELGSGVTQRLILNVTLDGRVLSFAAIVCLAAGVMVGFGPARQASRTDVLAALQIAGEAGGRSRKRLRYWIVIPQICASLVLLLVTGAVARTLITSELADPGYDVSNLVSVSFDLPEADRCIAQTRDQEREYWKQWSERRRLLGRRVGDLVRGLPSVESSAMSIWMPLQAMSGGTGISQEDFARGQYYGIMRQMVTPGYFNTMRIPLIAGRDFQESERVNGPATVVIVSNSLAKTMWPGRSALGQLMAVHQAGQQAPKQWAEVIGIAADVLPPINDGWPAPIVYETAGSHTNSLVLARARGAMSDVIRDISTAIAAVDPKIIVRNARPVVEVVNEARLGRRLAVAILGVAGLIGVVLAGIGLYGVVSFSLTQRLRELGIRTALGAERGDLIRLVVKEGMIVAAVGSALGLALAYAAIGLVSSKLVAIPTVSASMIVAVPLLIFGVVLLACYLPARRASKVDPMVVLRGL
jgi:putative ABC transport system permease protein